NPRASLRLTPEACASGPAPELPAALLKELSAQALPSAHAVIRKDGGDDPDATSGALVTASVFLRSCPTLPCDAQDFVLLEGGPGVGRVTLPGLPVPVGMAAINPVPQAQIRFALGRVASRAAQGGRLCPPLLTVISVRDGAAIARRTFNPRLGIVGGISILGTQGTVRPFSHTAWQATIIQGLDVALATGCRTICLSTGRRSERLLMARYPGLAPQAFVQAADFVQFSLNAAGAQTFEEIVWGCFFGKLVKLAQGHGYTHARESELDMAELARTCRTCGAACAPAVSCCVTAGHALELILADPACHNVLASLSRQAARVAHLFAGRRVRLHLFHLDGRELIAS
ncbi:MAG: cobalt-precorrin-5B (C(1))-methyltransferase CbiD, partial [Desulfovibrionaceae bacterium]|nr:cobalt-precorrin-5B (C(1))-methyltransferase CbiD [Desulfovibrionaceae bacterium]